MKHFRGVFDVDDVNALVSEAIWMKNNPLAFAELGKGKKLGMIFMNPSLRTRVSTEMAARDLGMEVQVLNMADAWTPEFEEGAVMDGRKVEHIKEAAGVLGRYFDLLAVRAFPALLDREVDDAEGVMKAFEQYGKKPILSLESATRHPLQSLADLITLAEQKKKQNPKVVLTWAPHVKVLPQAVAHSFAEWTLAAGHELHIVHPPGLDLDPRYTRGAHISNDQQEALRDADFIYVKNWSKREPYGVLHENASEWMLNEKSLRGAPNARIMHCLPVRRNLELSDELLDSPRSLVLEQAENRLWAARVVLKNMLTEILINEKATVHY
ncbi:MAG: Rossmann-fold NAD(P)-binding domain-containing protein [Bacteroidia bacterium]